MKLVVAAALVVALGAAGLGAEGKLRPTSIEVAGTGSAAAAAILCNHFGDSAPFVILLKGPARSLDRQGPALVQKLRGLPGATTVSPWDKGALKQLRPSPWRALVLADFHVDAEIAVKRTVPRLKGILEGRIHPPVVAIQSSFATLSRTNRSHPPRRRSCWRSRPWCWFSCSSSVRRWRRRFRSSSGLPRSSARGGCSRWPSTGSR